MQETTKAFLESSHSDIPASLRERHLESLLREKLASLEIDLLSGSNDRIKIHLRKSFQRMPLRALNLSERLRLNLIMKRVILDQLSRTFNTQIPQLAAVRMLLERAVDDLLLELERAWRRRRREEGRDEPIMDALFEAKRGLASEQQFLNTLVDQSPQAIVTLDKEGRILTWNAAAESIVGYGSDEIVGLRFAKLFKPPKALTDVFNELKAHGRIQNKEMVIRRKGGEHFHITLSVAILARREELDARYLCMFGDITEQVRAREQAAAVEKLSALAGLSAAVAHEIRNPLNTLSLTIDVLEEVLGGVKGLEDEEVAHRLRVLREEIDQMSEITNTYLMLARLPMPRMEFHDITSILKEFTARMALDLKSHGINLVEKYAEDLPKVLLDERQVRRVLHNIFRNAFEAMPEGGTLRLRSWHGESAVNVELSDTGPGISDSMREKLFIPFQTGKDGGTGLGLYLVREILRAHGGSVTIESGPKGGTTATLSIPVKPVNSPASLSFE